MVGPSGYAAAGGILDPGRCIVGCSGAIEVASELMFVPDSVALVALVAVAGESVLVGWLTDLCGTAAERGVDAFSFETGVSRGFLVGELSVPSSEVLRK